MINPASAQPSSESLTWRDMLRWSGIIGPIAAFAFWGGAQLTGISAAQAQMQRDITDIKVSVATHSKIDGHPQLERRVLVLETRGHTPGKVNR